MTLAGSLSSSGPTARFTARLSMPDRRQVLPVVASSADGVEQRTVVLAVERNTKVMEPYNPRERTESTRLARADKSRPGRGAGRRTCRRTRVTPSFEITVLRLVGLRPTLATIRRSVSIASAMFVLSMRIFWGAEKRSAGDWIQS